MVFNTPDQDTDRFAEYETEFDPLQYDRQARRKRKPKSKHQPKKTSSALISEIAQTEGLEGGFKTTYKLSQYEETFLLESLRPFYERTLISDVEAIVKGGKEANVYRCTAHPNYQALTGETHIAAKVYRPRMFRSLRNDAIYREGRTMLTSEGRAVKERDTRLKRAVRDKSDMGAAVMHTSWLMHEFNTMQKLYEAGADVPKPISSAPNALLMTYIGDELLAAPPLAAVSLEPEDAQELFEIFLSNLHTLCEHGLIHGDLSAYNILYWEGDIMLIDFPQVVEGATNPNAEMILSRDITRVCEYFMTQGVEMAGKSVALAALFWERYFTRNLQNEEADRSRLLETPVEEPEEEWY